MAIKRTLVVSVDSSNNKHRLSLELPAGQQLIFLNTIGLYDSEGGEVAMTLTQEAIFELREGLTAILDAIRDNAAGR